MNKKKELNILREMSRIYGDPPGSVARSVRLKWSMRLVSFFFLCGAFFLHLRNANGIVCIVLATIGGAVFGIAEIFAMSVVQIPLIVKYSSLKSEIEKRMAELGDA